MTLPSNSHKPSFFHFLITNLLWPNHLNQTLQTLFFWLANCLHILILLYFQFVTLSPSTSVSSRPAPARFPIITTIVNILALDSPDSFVNFLLVVFLIYSSVLLASALLVVLRSYLKRELTQNQRILVYYIAQIHSCLGFWIVTGFFIAGLTTSQFEYIAWKMIFVFMIACSYMIGFIFALLSFDPFPSSNTLATHSLTFHLIDFIAKAITLPIIATNGDERLALWIFGLACLIMSVLRLSYLMRSFPYYCSRIMKYSVRISAVLIIISITNVLGIVLRNSTLKKLTMDLFYIEVLLVLFAIKLSDLLFKNILQNSILTRETNSQNKAIRKVFALRYILERAKFLMKGDKEDLFLLKLQGYLNYLNSNIETTENIDLIQNRNLFADKINFLIQKIYKDTVNKTKKNAKIRVLLAYHSLQLNNNLPYIMSYLAENLKTKGLERIIAIHFLNQATRHQFRDTDEEGVDIKALLDYEETYQNFSQKAYSISKQVLRFWETYLGPNLELINLLQISKQIEKADDKIQKFWTRVIESNKQLLPSLINLYNCYLALIRNLPEQSFKLHQKYQNNHDFLQKSFHRNYGPLDQSNLNCLGNIVVYVSLSKDKLGEIKYISANVKELLKWSREDLLSKSINTLMLPLFKEAHNKIFIKLLHEGPRSTIINKNLESFAQNKEGHAVPVHLYLAMHPSIHSLDELTYVLILRLRKPENEMIIFNKAGIIEGATSQISKNLSIPRNQRVSINIICRNIQIPEASHPSEVTSTKFNPYTEGASCFHYQTSIHIQHLFQTQLYILNVFYYPTNDDQKEVEHSFYQEEEAPSERIPPLSSGRMIDIRQTTTIQGLLSPQTSDRFHNILQRLPSSKKMANDKNTDSSFEVEEVPRTERQEDFQVKRKQASSVKTPRYEKIRAELEENVYSLPKTIKSTVLIILYSLICSMLLLTVYLENRTTLVTIGKNTLIASNLSRQLGNLVQLNQWIMRYTLLDEGVFDSHRYDWLAPANLRASSISRFQVSIARMAPIQKGLRDEFDDIVPESRPLFFKKFPIYMRDSTTQVMDRDIFELVDQIMAAIQDVISTPYLEIHSNMSAMAFINDNTLDNVLTYGETLIDFVLEGIQQKLDHLTRLLQAFTMVAFGLAFLVLAFILYVLRVSINEKSKISILMLYLDQEGTKHHLAVVENFCGMLEKNGMDGRKMDYLASEKTLQQKNEKFRQVQIYRERFASKRDIHKREIKILLISIFLLAVLSFGFVTLIILLPEQNKEVQKNIDIILDCDLNQYHSLLLFYSTYAYIGFNTTSSIRNMPISESWEISFRIVKKYSAKFIILAQENQQENGNHDIEKILTGNLCDILISQGPPAKVYCPKGLHGVIKKGLIQTASSIMSTLSTAKSLFDSSNKTIEAITEVMGWFDLVEAEPMGFNYWFPAYGAISDMVRNQFDGNKQDFGKNVERIILAWMALYLVVGPVVLWMMFRSLRKWRQDWRKMIRLVPAAMVESNKMLRSYIAQKI